MTQRGHDRGERARGALAGVLSAGLLLGVAELVAGVTGAPAPLLAVGDAVVRFSPPAVTQRAIAWFGTNDKLVLLVVTAVLVVAAAALAGVLAVRRPLLGAGVAVAVAAVGVAGALLAPGARPGDPVPTLVGAAVAIPALLLLARAARVRPAATDDPESAAVDARGAAAAEKPGSTPGSTAADTPGSAAPRSAPVARRAFLGLGAAVAAGAAGLFVAGRAVGGRLRNATASRAGLRLPRAAETAGPAPAGAEVSPRTPFRTPNADFYRIDTALSVPQLPAQDWSLRIHGMVERELSIDWSDLVSRRMVEREITLVCVSNEVGGRLNGNAVWLGTSLGDLLREAGVSPDADMLLSTSVDGYTASTPLEVALEEENALLAVGMNGEPLPLEHGFPVRMVIPGLYGYVSATKWLVDLEVTRFDTDEAFWTPRGYADRAPIKVSSRIDVPEPFAALDAGTVPVAGVAWAPGRGITGVEVRVDDGPWSAATLAPVPGVDTWQQWSWAWDASSPGQHRLEVRATDGDGTTQTSERAPIKPDGTTGWHSVVVTVA